MDWEAEALKVEVNQPSTDWTAIAERAEGIKQAHGGVSRRDIQYDSEAGADLGTIATTSFADDPQKKIQFFASKRFPNLPIEESIKRYGIIDDEIVYRGDDGQIYSETPTMMDRIASHLSKALPIGTGTVAGVVTAPWWLAGPGGAAGSVATTSAAAGTGEEMRQQIGKKLLGDPVDHMESVKEGAFALGGEAVGGLLIRQMGKKVARDIGKMDAADVETLQRLSQKYGVELTPAEMTNLPSMKAKQKALSNITESADTMGEFAVRRAGQVDTAVGKYLDDISPVDSAEVAGRQAREAANTSIQSARKVRQEAAGDLYSFVNDPRNLIEPYQFKPIADDEFLASIIKKVKGDPLHGMKDMPDNALPVLDAAKKELDDMIEKASRYEQRNRVRLLNNKRNELLEIADGAFPEYRQARAAFAGESPEVDALEKGIVGVISKLKDTNAKDAAKKLFSATSSGPEAVRTAKVAIRKTDPEAWQAVKRSWLQEHWDKASQSFISGNPNKGAKFSSYLLGNKKNREILKEALEPNEYQTLEELSQVLDAASRVKPVGSDTAWNQELMKIARDESRPALAKVARSLRVASWPKMLEEWATEKNLRNVAAKTADIVTSPDAMKNLKELQKVSPGSAKAAVLAAHVLGITTAVGVDQAGDALFSGETDPPDPLPER